MSLKEIILTSYNNKSVVYVSGDQDNGVIKLAVANLVKDENKSTSEHNHYDADKPSEIELENDDVKELIKTLEYALLDD